MSKESRFKPSSTIDYTDLKAVAGMLRRTTVEKPDDAEIEKRIEAQLRDEDDATKRK